QADRHEHHQSRNRHPPGPARAKKLTGPVTTPFPPLSYLRGQVRQTAFFELFYRIKFLDYALPDLTPVFFCTTFLPSGFFCMPG
ncbi:MAG TPA: hypothetical protein VF663_00815, partial [Telluria sp.]